MILWHSLQVQVHGRHFVNWHWIVSLYIHCRQYSAKLKHHILGGELIMSKSEKIIMEDNQYFAKPGRIPYYPLARG